MSYWPPGTLNNIEMLLELQQKLFKVTLTRNIITAFQRVKNALKNAVLTYLYSPACNIELAERRVERICNMGRVLQSFRCSESL